MCYDLKKEKVRLEQNGFCNKCGLNTWLNEPIVLEIHHIDHDSINDTRENLEGLCPNCHSVTDNWRGRGKKFKRNKLNKKKISSF